MSKSKRPDSNPSGHGCKRKTFSIEEKLEIIKRFERNERTCDIARATGIKESTLRAIRDNAVKIKETSMTGITTISSKSVRIRPKEIAEMERLLSIWIEGKKSKTTFLTVKGKALSIYADLKRKSPNPAEVAPFRASCGWFSGFKNRYNFQNLQFSSESSSAEHKAAREFPAMVQKLIKEEGYTLDQIFNFDETIIYYKRMLGNYHISRGEKSPLGHKASKDRLTVMFGANASGDLKLKPVVIYRSDNPPALKGIVKASLGVHYRYSKKGWMTTQICIDIFAEFFPVIEYYCKKKNLAFKILIIIDNAPSHPPTIAELNPKVKFVFLPQETTPLIQPFGQGVMALFKAYYLKRTLKMLIAATGGENAEMALEFWKRCNIKMAIDIIVEAWNDVTKECLHRAWKKMLPNLIHDYEEFEPSEQLKQIKTSCLELAKQVGFEEVEDEDIDKLLELHSNELTTEDLQQLADGQAEAEDEEDDEDEDEDEDDEDDNEIQRVTPRQLDTSQLSSVLSVIEKQLQWLEDNDYNAERSRIVVHGIRTNLEPYRQLLYERRRLAKQQKLDIYFKVVRKRRLEEMDPYPSTSGTTTSGSVSPSSASQ